MFPDPRELFEHLVEKLRERGDEEGAERMEACARKIQPKLAEAAG